MSTPVTAPILLVGLSGSGKTNFLVALDIILDNQKDPEGLVHSERAEDRAYVQPLREKWLRGEELGHTSRLQTPDAHELLILHPPTNTKTTFHIPDVAGETFDAHFKTRTVPEHLKTRLKECKGIILFLHCDDASEHELMEHPYFAEDKTEEDNQEKEREVKPEDVDDWTIEMSSKQTKVVDILQFFLELRPEPLPIAVAISAWDRVENSPKALANDMPKDPEQYIRKRWPLLSQFFRCNKANFPHRFFGISARGGGHKKEDIERLTAFAEASERVILRDGDHRSNDLTRPVRWILNLLK